MNGYLLDTNVISLFAPGRADADPAFIAWAEEQEQSAGLFICAVTIHEIEKGIRLLEAKGATAKAAALNGFLHGLIAGYADRILAVDARVALAAGALEARAVLAGHSPGASDAMIAAAAAVQGLTIVTRNRKHFEPFDVPVVMPENISLEGYAG